MIQEEAIIDPATPDYATRIGLVESALEAAVQMVEELADDFTKFREETRKSFAELATAPDTVTPAMLLRESKRLEEMIDSVAQKADPIAAFRSRLKGEVTAEHDLPPEPVAEVAPVAPGPIRCSLCGQRVASSRGLKVHLHGCVDNPERDTARRCPKCSREFVRITPFMHHLEGCFGGQR